MLGKLLAAFGSDEPTHSKLGENSVSNAASPSTAEKNSDQLTSSLVPSLPNDDKKSCTEYYRKEYIDDLLRCPKCRELFDEPRILPCGETLCSKCISKDQQQVGQRADFIIDCFLCSQIHQIPNIGFPCNQILMKLLDKTKSIKVNHMTNKLDKALNALNKKVVEYAETSSNSSATVHKHMSLDTHFTAVRSEIDTVADMIVGQVNDMRKKLIEELNEFKADGNKTESELRDDFIATIESFKQSVYSMLNDKDADEIEIESAIRQCNEYIGELKRRTWFGNVLTKKPKFVKNENTKLKSSFLGQIVVESMPKVVEGYECPDLDASDMKICNLKGTPNSQELYIAEFWPNRFIISSYDSFFKKSVLKLFDCDNNVHENFYNFERRFKNFTFCTNKDLLFVAYFTEIYSRGSIVKKFENYRSFTASTKIDSELISLTVNSTTLFALSKKSPCKVAKYNFDLNYLDEINCAEKLKVIKANDTYLYGHTGSTLCVIPLDWQQQQKLPIVSRLTNIDKDFIVVGENVIVSINREMRRLEYYTSLGVCMRVQAEPMSLSIDWTSIRLVQVHSYKLCMYDTNTCEFYYANPPTPTESAIEAPVECSDHQDSDHEDQAQDQDQEVVVRSNLDEWNKEWMSDSDQWDQITRLLNF